MHGGPGFDHTSYKPALSALADLVQIVYLDHRGNGRSGEEDPKAWNLAQWGDDVKAFCDVLGIEKPIVYGASFGGMVALTYATRHPAHPGKPARERPDLWPAHTFEQRDASLQMRVAGGFRAHEDHAASWKERATLVVSKLDSYSKWPSWPARAGNSRWCR